MANCQTIVSRLLEPSSLTLLEDANLLEEFLNVSKTCAIFVGTSHNPDTESLDLEKQFSAKRLDTKKGKYGILVVYDGIIAVFQLTNKPGRFFVFKNILYSM